MMAPKMVIPTEVWALRDIDLEVQTGECVGIIGNNGSGKSTLLAVIGGIISPTTGAVAVEGELSVLLDLSVGMQMELTGRDNVVILGGLLGLTNAQIQERSQQMIDFSELREAIDRPVKTYSTGMTMRLGFAVALHVDFDVLVVDEVLAVGDSNFHRKCINHLRGLHLNSGKTIIIASQGQIINQGETEDVLRTYWQDLERQRNLVGHRVNPLKDINPYGDDLGDIVIELVRFVDHKGQETNSVKTGQPLRMEVWFNAKRPVHNPLFRIQIFRNDGVWVQGMNSARHGVELGVVQGRGCMRLQYEIINLLEAEYFISVGIWPDEYTSFITDVAYDMHEMSYVLHVTSDRNQGAGIVFQHGHWEYWPPGETRTAEQIQQLKASGRLDQPRPSPLLGADDPSPAE
jgi:ABC-2 type transport system ATP-binding protein/lipopolysaccharide transport system ATP-binding protein